MQSIIVSLLVIFSKFWAVEEEYPKPNFYAIATVNSVYDGAIDTATLFKQKKLLIYSDKNLKINGFTLQYTYKGYSEVLTSKDEYFTTEQIQSFRKFNFDHSVAIHHIVAEYKNKKYNLNPILLQIIPKEDLNQKNKIDKSIKYATYMHFSNISNSKSKMLNQFIDSVPNYKIISHKLYPWFAIKGLYGNIEVCKGRNWSPNTVVFFNKINAGGMIILHDIKAITPNNDTVLLTPISISIR